MESKIFYLFAREAHLILGSVTFTAVPALAEGMVLSWQDQSHTTHSETWHQLFSWQHQTMYGLVMSPQVAQGTGTHAPVLALLSCLWQSCLHKVFSWPRTCSRDVPGADALSSLP